MLSEETKELLVQVVTDEDAANEIEARLAQSTPASAQDAQDLLDSYSMSVDEVDEYTSAFQDAGPEISDRIRAAEAVLKAKANGVGQPAQAASFEGQVAGMTTDVTIDADNVGEDGNSILLAFDGILDIDAVIAAWNLANPANTATLSAGDGSQIPDNLEEIALAGGTEDGDADLSAALAAFGSEELSEESLEVLVVAFASEEAAEEFKDYYNSFVAAISSISNP